MDQIAEAYVLDASVATKWFLTDEELSSNASALLVRFVEDRVKLIAPYHVHYEVASAITVATLGQRPACPSTKVGWQSRSSPGLA